MTNARSNATRTATLGPWVIATAAALAVLAFFLLQPAAGAKVEKRTGDGG